MRHDLCLQKYHGYSSSMIQDFDFNYNLNDYYNRKHYLRDKNYQAALIELG